VSLGGAVLAGAQAGNYSLTSVAATSANITAKPVTGSFTAMNKPYDGTTVATVTGRSVTPIAGDSLTLSGGTAAFADSNVGVGKTVTLAGATLAGGDAGNYILSGVNTATANITAVPLTIKLDANPTTPGQDGFSKLLGEAAPAFSLAYTGFITGEGAANLGGTLVLTFAGVSPTVYPASVVAPTTVGSYSVIPSGLTSGNYTITFVGGSYSIQYLWDGFLQPINDTAHDAHTTAPFSSFKTGQTIPVKFELKNANGQIVTQSGMPTFNRSGNLGACNVATIADTVDLAVAPDSDGLYKLTGTQYNYGWSTKGLSAGMYQIYAKLADNSTRSVYICLTK
jgi:hypothetical protein